MEALLLFALQFGSSDGSSRDDAHASRVVTSPEPLRNKIIAGLKKLLTFIGFMVTFIGGLVLAIGVLVAAPFIMLFSSVTYFIAELVTGRPRQHWARQH